MYLPDRDLYLTYCTNIHPSNGWDNVFENIQRYAPLLRERLNPGGRLGIGLLLSNAEMTALREPERLQAFRDYLDANNLFVFTLNGFVYGEFHSPRIKDTIHAPDWRTSKRVAYSLGLIDVLAALLPDDMPEGSFSTQPLSYKHWSDVNPDDPALWRTVTDNLVTVVEKLVRVRVEQGKFLHIDIEPEPDCLIETGAELVTFFEEWLLTHGAKTLAGTLDITEDAARQHLLDHVQVCYDTCHVAVAYEDANTLLDEFERVGIRVGKVQVSSALRVSLPANVDERDEQAAWLEPFAEHNFLHQVLQRNRDGSCTQYRDLPQALPHITDADAAEWRIHYHVPIFVEQYHPQTSTTQNAILEAFDALRARQYTRFLEIETYTWEVLPPDKRLPLLDSIEREFRWVLSCL
jgi:sugar phosphate isomerase/epimerase